MALGAINALKEAKKLDKVKVLGFDGNQDAVDAVKNGEMVATVLQPIVEGTTKADRPAGQRDHAPVRPASPRRSRPSTAC